MKKVKKLTALLLALVMAVALAACGSTDANTPADDDAADGPTFEKMTLSASTAGAEGSNFAAALEKFKELVAEKTGGAVTVQIYTSDQLTNGNQSDSVQGTRDGTIDLCFEADGVWGNFDTRFCVPNLPFIFSSYEDVMNNLINGAGGEYYANLLDTEFGVKCLGIGDNGFRYITNSKHPIETPDDLSDLKLRVGGSPILTGCYDLWGADYTTAAWAEVYTGLQTHLYDGQENPVAVANASSIQEVQNYVTAWTANYGCMYLTMNSALYNSLSDELKEIVNDCGKEACAYQVELTRQQCEDCLQEWQNDYGIEVYEMSAENAQLFADMAAPLYDQYADYADLIALMRGE